MSWFKRKEKGITTPTTEKKDSPDGMWYKTPSGKIIHMKELKMNAYVTPDENYHVRIGSKEYFEILFDNNEYEILHENLSPADPLKFVDSQAYKDRIVSSQKKTGMKDALSTGFGHVNGLPLVVCCMDFTFIGGSMGSVVGEKISRAVDVCLEKKVPLMIISKSGGARMMEAGFSLMQMAKSSAKLARLSEAKLPYISLMTDPTTGGVTASFAMLGDFNIAEPGALIGFAGPRVIRETIGKDLPKGFQSAEFLLEHGFLDFIVPRYELKKRISTLLGMLKK
jgi:acetyl-CoA carboxylase carboxyl transferase subunit beta